MVDDRKTVLITGGTKGIGFATARGLASRGHRVVLTGRVQAACDDAARAIASSASGAQVVGMALDLASLASVREFARAFLAEGRPLHVLINNAGQLSLDKTLRLTGDGIESTLATNAIGPFLLTQLLREALLRSAPARIVNVSSRVHMPNSGMAGEVSWDWDNLRGEKSFDPVVFYKNSKLAMMWMTYELDRRLAATGITVNAVCPGFVPETLAEHRRGLSRWLYKHVMTHLPGTRTVAQAADNTLFAATDPAYATKGGVFIGERKEIPSSDDSYDEAKAKRFWKLACELTGTPEAAT
jgi:retinol dehydrogenase-12